MVQYPQRKNKYLREKSIKTGLYYLQSRYYNPNIGRFLNADSLVSTGQGLLGNNMFAYCRNNPVSRKDASGTDDVTVYLDDGSDGTAYNEPIDPEDVSKDGARTYTGYGGKGKSSAWNGGSFRKNLQKFTGKSGKGQQAHHVFPQKFIDKFEKIGVKIHDAKNGAWWESSEHQKNSYQYNLWWEAFSQ